MVVPLNHGKQFFWKNFGRPKSVVFQLNVVSDRGEGGASTQSRKTIFSEPLLTLQKCFKSSQSRKQNFRNHFGRPKSVVFDLNHGKHKIWNHFGSPKSVVFDLNHGKQFFWNHFRRPKSVVFDLNHGTQLFWKNFGRPKSVVFQLNVVSDRGGRGLQHNPEKQYFPSHVSSSKGVLNHHNQANKILGITLESTKVSFLISIMENTKFGSTLENPPLWF